ENLLNTPRDILFYENDPAIREGIIPLEVGTFAVYFPWDVHVPAIAVNDSPAKIRKIVVKVPLDSCMK
ncbi:MAG: YhcH/YjgK/YiaL family protein, partial [Synergistaceae bacterium]|nr:YhcH/YjgK/YiaL family protein [Synergistaceae bacterium]